MSIYGQRSKFARGRAIALSYVIFVSFLMFFICIFVLPSAATKVPLLALVSGISFFAGCLTFLSLLGSKLCKRRTLHQVGLEIIWSVCLVPIEVLNTAVCVAIGRGSSSQQQNNGSDTSQGASAPMSPSSARNFSVLLASCTGSVTVLLLFYAMLIIILALYTSRKRRGSRTRSGDIWFEVVDGPTCPFLIPSGLRFLLQPDDNEGTPVPPFTAALPGHPSLNDFAGTGENSAHHCAPSCSCGEKPPPRPSNPEDFREIQRMRLQAKKQVISEAGYSGRWSLSNILGKNKKDSKTRMIPHIRVPTDRDRRRSQFTVAFDVV